MKFFRRIFGSVKPSYLIRSYVIGFILFGLIVTLFMSAKAEGNNGPMAAAMAYFFLCTLLFPFAKLTWDELRDLALGNNVIFMNAIPLFVFKYSINVFLWGFALFVAPFGILYLWFRSPPTGTDPR